MIGIFDSGLGGLTVAREIMRLLSDYPVVYFGDTARTPYGNKSKKAIERYAIENTKFLLSKGAKIIVIACNTASALAYDTIKKTFKAPVFEVITPAVNEAVAVTKNGHLGIIGTRSTVNSGVYEKKIKTFNFRLKTYNQPCPLLVPLIEEGWIGETETENILKEYLAPLRRKNIDTLILGCTHYPLLKPLIKKVMGKKVRLVDSAEAAAYEVARKVKEIPLASPFVKGGLRRIYVSDRTPYFQKIAENWLGQKIKLQIAKL